MSQAAKPQSGSQTKKPREKPPTPQQEENAEVIDIPIPGMLKPVWLLLVGQYLFVSDDFLTTVRKVGTFIFLFNGLMGNFAVSWHWYMFALEGHLADFLVGVGFLVGSIFMVAMYIRMCMLKHVTDAMALTICIGAVIIWTSTHFCSTSYDTRWLDFGLIIVAMVFQVPGLLWFWGWLLMLVIQGVYSDSYKHVDGAFVPLVPDTRVTTGLEPLLLGLLSWMPGILIGAGAWFSFEESKRQVRVSNKSTLLAQRVAFHLRQYNTEKVQQLVDEARGDKEGNEELIVSFAALVENLERYRPFLPNYLFLDTDSASDGGEDGAKEDTDDEGSIIASEYIISPPDSEAGLKLQRSQASSDDAGSHRKHGDRVRSGASSVRSNTRTRGSHVQLITGAASDFFGSQRTVSSLGASAGAGAGAASSGSHYRGTVSYARVEIKSNEWFSHHLATKTHHEQRTNMNTFTDILFDTAKVAKASVHSMLGDCVQLSWNATHRVQQPEIKAAKFLLNLRSKLLSSSSSSLTVAGACCSGLAEVHSVFSATTKQQALYIDGPWLPSQDCCYDLATAHQALVVDANTERGAHFEVVSSGIDCIRYQPRVATGNSKLQGGGPADQSMPVIHQHFTTAPLASERMKFDSIFDHPDAPHISGGVHTSTNSSTGSAPLQLTLAFELISLQSRADDEWMYQLQDQRIAEDSIPAQVLRLAVQGKFGEAVVKVNEAEHRKPQQGGQTSPGATAIGSQKMIPPSSLEQRMYDFCENALTHSQKHHSDV